LCPRASPSSDEAEICARGPACFSIVLDVPLGNGRPLTCIVARGRNHVVAPRHDRCLVSHYAPMPLRGVGVCIKCECYAWDQLGRDRRSGGDFGRGRDLPKVGDPLGEASG
jgi:hypothetical protein